MKIFHISHSDTSGGAARAAFRLHCTLKAAGHSSRMLVQKKLSDDITVTGPASYIEKFIALAQVFLGEQYLRLQRTEKSIPHTTSCGFPVSNPFLARHIDTGNIVHLHWFREVPTIAAIGRINKPVLWTLHDMWAFCGAEHYTSVKQTSRWREGYTKANRPAREKGLDINRITWNRKKKHWQSPLHIVAPSSWLGRCAAESALMREWPIHVIPNVLATTVFKPIDQGFARQVLNLPQGGLLVLFGAIKGGDDPRKGFDLLLETLSLLNQSSLPGLQVVIFGQSQPRTPPKLTFPIRWMGHIHDEWTLVLLYNAADVMIIPSRQENLPQTGTEAQSCGCPVVAFDTTGLPDVVVHKKTGYLAKPFDSTDLAHGISWVLAEKERHHNLCVASRERAVRLWAPDIVVPQYLDIYQMAIEQHRKKQ